MSLRLRDPLRVRPETGHGEGRASLSKQGFRRPLAAELGLFSSFLISILLFRRIVRLDPVLLGCAIALHTQLRSEVLSCLYSLSSPDVFLLFFYLLHWL